MADAAQTHGWWAQAPLTHADPRTLFGRLVGLLVAHHLALVGTDAAAHLTALHNLRIALEVEERVARRTLEGRGHAD